MISLPQRSARNAGMLALLALAAPSALATIYVVKDLGELTDLPGHNDAKPNAISSNGAVAAANATNGQYYACLYAGGWTNLGTLGGTNSFGFGVNQSGNVAGRSITTTGYPHAFLWTPGGTGGVAGNPQMKDLGTLAGGTQSEADAINDTNQITGYSQTTSHAVSYDHAFRYSNGTMTDIGTLLAALPDSYGVGLNDAGHIVGIAYDAAFTAAHAFLYDGSTATDIGGFTSNGTSAVAINDSDEITGYSTLTNFYVHAFRYAGGVMQDLGTLGGDYSYGIAINNSNVIVGGSFTDAGVDSIYHAFIATGNSMADLNDQLDATGSGWTLSEARGINDSGQITGVGQFNGINHAFLLEPEPEITGVKIIGTNVVMSFTTVSAATYAVAWRIDLANGSWSNLVSGIGGTGGIITITNPVVADQPRCFYRASLSAP